MDWTRRFNALPPGLTAREIAQRLDCPLRTAQHWAKRMAYKLDRTPRLSKQRKKAHQRWRRVDWSLPNAQIARSLRVSRQAVFEKRKEFDAVSSLR